MPKILNMPPTTKKLQLNTKTKPSAMKMQSTNTDLSQSCEIKGVQEFVQMFQYVTWKSNKYVQVLQIEKINSHND